MKSTSNNMIKQIPITKKNLVLASLIQRKIFPNYSALKNYQESIDKTTANEYFLLFNNQTPIGISGFYINPEYPDSSWLGWFGILPEYRKKSFGSQALDLYEKKAKEKGCLFARIYTDKFNNENTISFYEHHGYIKEYYICKEDSASIKYPLFIMSKSLGDYPLTLWNNRNIQLNIQIKKQNKLTNPIVFREIDFSEINQLKDLYSRSLFTDHYFQEHYSAEQLKKLLDTSFDRIFRYMISNKGTIGVFEDGSLIGFVLFFDYFILKKDIKMFNTIFTLDENNSSFLYEKELHSKITKHQNNVLYILAIAVDEKYRNLSLASLMIDELIRNNPSYIFVSDVSNPKSLPLYQKRSFKVETIDKNYFLVTRLNSND